jgi:beta-phosphoglucomutase family hydrolase
MAKIEAVIWDLDGVLANTASYHLSAWQEIFSKRGVKFTEEDFRRSFGQRNDTIIKNTLGEQTTQGEIEAIAEEKEATFRRMIGQKIKPFPGAVELVYSLRRQGVKLAIASSTPIENIRLITSSLGVANCFQAIVTGHDVTEGKPSPQVFLLAAKRLGAEPENCIVIEDAVAGVTAAKRAGMHCVAVTSTRSRQSLKQADLIVRTLEEISIKDLEELVRTS